MFVDPLDDLSVHERAGGRIPQIELDTAFFLDDMDIEGLVTLQQFLAIIKVVATIEYRERTIAESRVQTALTGIEELADLGLGQNLETALRRNDGIDNILFHKRTTFSMHGPGS